MKAKIGRVVFYEQRAWVVVFDDGVDPDQHRRVSLADGTSVAIGELTLLVDGGHTVVDVDGSLPVFPADVFPYEVRLPPHVRRMPNGAIVNASEVVLVGRMEGHAAIVFRGAHGAHMLPDVDLEAAIDALWGLPEPRS